MRAMKIASPKFQLADSPPYYFIPPCFIHVLKSHHENQVDTGKQQTTTDAIN